MEPIESNQKQQLDPLKAKSADQAVPKGVNLQSVMMRSLNGNRETSQQSTEAEQKKDPPQQPQVSKLEEKPTQDDKSRVETVTGSHSLIYNIMPKSFIGRHSKAALPEPSFETPKKQGVPPPHGPLSSDIPAGQKGKGAKYILAAILGVLILLAGYLVYTKIKKSPNNVSDKQEQSASENQKTDSLSSTTSAIPNWWRMKYFHSEVCQNEDICADNADPDHDGLTNLEEYRAGTDPNNPDSDGDGIADGDEVHVFNTDPLSSHTAGISKYTDSGDLKYKYNSRTHQPFTDVELRQIAANIKTYGLHSPTTKTLTAEIMDFYTNYGAQKPPAGPSESPPRAGALDRDTQRSDTIKQISFALLKYRDTSSAFPDTTDFPRMVTMIAPALSGRAINTSDPVNTTPYIYGYMAVNGAQDFQLSYFSETQNQAIVINSADARKNFAADQANQRDNKRKADLQMIGNALQLYSNDNASISNPSQKVYPSQASWKQALAPRYISVVPVDPQTNRDYIYIVSTDNQSFVLQALLENPPAGKRGYLCTQDGCGLY